MDWWINILETINNLKKGVTHKYDGEKSAVQAP